MIDSKKRSLIKSLVWRLIGIVILGAISFYTMKFFPGIFIGSLIITASFHLVRFILYYYHERLWENISWGKTKGLAIQMTGLSGAGKTTISEAVALKLKKNKIKVELIDGDEYRKNLCSDLGFSKEDRNENIKRLGFVASVLKRNNIVAIIAAINPYKEIREELEMKYGIKTVYVKCSLDKVKERDVKGLYAKACLPEGDPNRIGNFTGVSDPFDFPENADLILDTERETIEESVNKLYKYIKEEIGS